MFLFYYFSSYILKINKFKFNVFSAYILKINKFKFNVFSAYILKINIFFGIIITKTAIICGDGCRKLHHSKHSGGCVCLFEIPFQFNISNYKNWLSI